MTKNNIIMVMDFFFSEIKGGAELNAESLIERFSDIGVNIQKMKSERLTVDFMKKNKDKKFIFSNFILVKEECKRYAIENLKYAIYEQDHKYLKTRNPIGFVGFKAPKAQLANMEFYRNAVVVFFLTKLAKDIFILNTELDNVCNLTSSVWTRKDLKSIRKFCDVKKTKKIAIMDSQNPIKRTADCVRYCQNNNLEFELIKDNDFIKFMEKMSKFERLVFLTGHLETCARILVEAKMLNLKTTYQKRLIGAASEDWYSLSGIELIDKMEETSSNMPYKVLEYLSE